jgi:hypothetical protein
MKEVEGVQTQPVPEKASRNFRRLLHVNAAIHLYKKLLIKNMVSPAF